jgi:hypothetical protein
MLKSPTSYNEMLPSLNLATSTLTFLLAIVLTILDYVPRIKVPKEHLPPFGDDQQLADWLMSFGLVPIAAALVSLMLSRAFEMHNIISKLLFLRYAWDKFYVVKPLAVRAGSGVAINRSVVRRVMNDLYYPETRNLDPHYVHLFWRYALFFWILFEHAIIVAVALISLYFLDRDDLHLLARYLGCVIAVCAIQFFAVTSRKSRDQAEQIPIDKVRGYFNTLASPRPRPRSGGHRSEIHSQWNRDSIGERSKAAHAAIQRVKVPRLRGHPNWRENALRSDSWISEK